MITVGVAALNAAGTLPRLLDSLLGQEFCRDQMEIVVADNGSQDATRQVVAGYAAQGPVRLADAAHRRGPAVARNAIVAAARGDVIAFTDADCVAHPCWLAELTAAFAEPQVGCVAGAILAGEPHTATERFYARWKILTQDEVLAHRFLPYAQTANAAFRRDVFCQVGRFDEVMITGEDADLLWRMQLQTDYCLSYQPRALVWHQHRSSARGLVRQALGWGVGQALLYRKYRGRMRRDTWAEVAAAYRRIAGLTRLSVRRSGQVALGAGDREPLDDAYLSLLYFASLRLGRLKGSLQARVFYP